jgi:hypothetical protein
MRDRRILRLIRAATVTAPPEESEIADRAASRAALVLRLQQVIEQVSAIERPTTEDLAICQSLTRDTWDEAIGPVNPGTFQSARYVAQAHLNYLKGVADLKLLLTKWKHQDAEVRRRSATTFVTMYRSVRDLVASIERSDMAESYQTWLAEEVGVTYRDAYSELEKMVHRLFAKAAAGMNTNRSDFDQVRSMWTSTGLAELSFMFKYRPVVEMSDLICIPWAGRAGDGTFDELLLHEWAAYAWQNEDQAWARVILMSCQGRSSAPIQILGECAYWKLMRLAVGQTPPIWPTSIKV